MADDFYVGYRRRAPEGTARFARRVLPLLGCLAAGLAAMLAYAQAPFDPGRFEFGVLGVHEGTLWEGPTPLLAIERPGRTPRMAPLVLPGKHGAASAVAGLDGRHVAVEATRIERGAWLMLEIRPGTLRDLGPGREPPPEAPLGRLAARGEIVDGKCFLGVMKPGRGKVHRACAARCLAGGVPPMFRVAGETEDSIFLLVPGAEGVSPQELARWAGRPVVLEGDVRRRGDAWILTADWPPEAARDGG